MDIDARHWCDCEGCSGNFAVVIVGDFAAHNIKLTHKQRKHRHRKAVQPFRSRFFFVRFFRSILYRIQLTFSEYDTNYQHHIHIDTVCDERKKKSKLKNINLFPYVLYEKADECACTWYTQHSERSVRVWLLSCWKKLDGKCVCISIYQRVKVIQNNQIECNTIISMQIELCNAFFGGIPHRWS